MAASSSEAENQALDAIFAKHLKDLSLENSRIENIDGVFFAIDFSAKPLKGSGGTVYPAYPIDFTGKIHKNIQLMAKIVEYQDESPSMRQRNWQLTQIEAKNGDILYSSRAMQVNGGAIILMSKILGISLLALIQRGKLNRKDLKPIRRILLAINAVKPFEKLTEAGILPKDITAGNTLIHLPTLGVTPIDLGSSHETELTKAPENEVTAESMVYSIGLDILIPILSGLRSEKNKAGEITNIVKIKEAILLNFVDPSTNGISPILLNRIIPLIEKMCSHNPNARGTLKSAKETLEWAAGLIREIEPLILDDAELSKYKEQLRVLEDKVLKDRIFNKAIDSKTSEKQAAEKKSALDGCYNFFQKCIPLVTDTLSTTVKSVTNAYA